MPQDVANCQEMTWTNSQVERNQPSARFRQVRLRAREDEACVLDPLQEAKGGIPLRGCGRRSSSINRGSTMGQTRLALTSLIVVDTGERTSLWRGEEP
jgi:hypothetical protein